MPPRSTSRRPSRPARPVARRQDPDRPHGFVINPGADQYQYDITKDLPPCPDTAPSGKWEMSARLWEGRFDRRGRCQDYRIRTYPTRRALDSQVRALRESEPRLAQVGYGQRRNIKLRESELDWWSYGLPTAPGIGAGLTSNYIPLLPGPATRQLYWADYFAMSAKAFEAYQHNPIAHRAVEIHTEFVIGRGVQAVAKTPRGQAVWDAYWRKNNMDERLESILGDLSTYGELFLRYFPQPDRSMLVRSLDPAGIYDIVTDQEDWETVYFYHQQQQERAQLFPPPGGDEAPTGPTSPDATTKYTIRQIPAQEIDHYRINARSGEVRGRSDLFPSLGYLKRLQDLLTSRVIRSDMQARMVFNLMVEGNAGDVNSAKGEMFPNNKPPEPGGVFAHNDKISLEAFQFQSATGETSDTTVDEIVEMCAVGVGVSRQYLWTAGKSQGGARAGALVATEPGQKRFEKRQRLTQRILRDMSERVFAFAGLTGEDAEIEFIFPSIAVEERSAALKDLAFAESMDWISKETSASMGARQLDIETYDFEDEQEKIAAEFEHSQEDEDDGEEPSTGPNGEMLPGKKATPKQGDGVIRRPMMNATMRQAPKLDPTKAGTVEDQPPGLLMPGAGAGETGVSGPTAPGRMGMPGDENPATQAGKANIRQDNSRAGGLRESDQLLLNVVTTALREAHLGRARVPRRRPDDPEFIRAAEHYHEASAQNARELVGAIHGAA